MIKELTKQYQENKHLLQKYFENTKQGEHTYESIVKKIFELCILKADDYYNFDIEKMKVIDDGDYQGTTIYIIPKNNYQPSANDYVYTNNYYGSCSGCDTLLAISGYSEDLPTKKQIKEYMLIALHLVQKLNWLK